MYIDKNKFKESLLKGPFTLLIILIYGHFFGEDNGSIGFMIALGALAFLKLNLIYEAKFKIITLLTLNIFLLCMSYLATLNVVIALIVNFIAFFSVTFIYTNYKKSSISNIFLFIYIFMLAYPTHSTNISSRFLALILGVVIIFALQYIFNNKKAHLPKYLIIEIINILISKIDLILKNDFSNVNQISISNQIKNILSTLSGNNSSLFKDKYNSLLNVTTSLEKIDFIINTLSNETKNIKIYKGYLIYFKTALKLSINTLDKKMDLEILKDYIEKLDLIFKDYNNLILYNNILKVFITNSYKLINDNSKLSSKLILLNILKNIKYKYKFNKFSLKYAFKVSISVSLAIFLVDIFNIPLGKWIIITVYVLIQPFSNETMVKMKNRLKGTTIGVLFFIFCFPFIIKFVPLLVVLLIALIFYFYVNDYFVKVIFTCIIGLSFNINGNFSHLNIDTISLKRFIFIFIASLLVLLLEKLLFQYNQSIHLNNLMNSYKNITYNIIHESKYLTSNNTCNTKLELLILKHHSIEEHILTCKKNHDNKLCEFINTHKTIIEKIKTHMLYKNLNDYENILKLH